MSTCLTHSTVVGCWNKADSTKENVVIHYTYATNASGVEIIKAIRYTTSDGTPIALPIGDIVTPGECIVCKKEIFATHDRYILTPGIPANAVAYEMTNDLPTQGLDVSNAYFHLIYPTLNGTAGNPIGPQLTEYFANPQSGILWSDIAGVQAVIDFVLPLMGLSVGDIIYTINTSNLPIFFLSPTAVTELTNNTYLHIYWGVDATHNNYNEKADVTVIANNNEILLGGESECITVQEIKEKDTCTGEETYRWVVEDGTGNLVEASTLIVGFDEALLSSTNCSCSSNPVTRERNHYVITGTTPLVITQGFLSLTITKISTSASGDVLISGDNSTDYPLTLQGEIYTIGVNEPHSVISNITVIGTQVDTSYKVIEIR